MKSQTGHYEVSQERHLILRKLMDSKRNKNEKWLHAMKSIPSYFGGRKTNEVASCEQLSPFPIPGEFPYPWKGGNSLSIGNGDNCSRLATSPIWN
jgi:hypothetical protein